VLDIRIISVCIKEIVRYFFLCFIHIENHVDGLEIKNISNLTLLNYFLVINFLINL